MIEQYKGIAVLFAVGRLPGAQCVHSICLMSPMLIGPDDYNMASKAISASKVNVFLKQHLARGGLAPVWVSAPPHQPVSIWSLRVQPMREPELDPQKPRVKSQVMHACNPSGTEMGEDA